MEYFDDRNVCRLELAYMQECYCGDEARVDYVTESPNSLIAEIVVASLECPLRGETRMSIGSFAATRRASNVKCAV